MKLILSILLLTATIHCLSENEKYALTDVEFDTYFEAGDEDHNQILNRKEAKFVLEQCISKVFQRIGFWKDEPMIEAIAEEIVKELSDEVDKQRVQEISKTLPNRVKTFRGKIFNDLIEKFQIEKIVNDPNVLKTLDTHPGAFGLTYENWKLHMVELDDLLKETKETLARLQELTKDIPYDEEEYQKFKKMIMKDVYADPEFKAIFDDFKDLTEQTQQLKDMIGEKGFAELENNKKVKDMLDL